MLLAVDIGNTDIVFGVYAEGQWVHIWRTPSLPREPTVHYQSYLKLQFLEAGLTASVFTKVVISSVVPVLTPVLTNILREQVGVLPVVVGPDNFGPVRIETDYPYELGSDLIANAVAAFTRYRRNCIVVDFGTALTFTTVTGDGRILGVAIVPGLKTAVKALFANTAQLPEVPLKLPTSAIGKNTTQSIQAGILLGYESLVKGLIARVREELGGDCIAVATGGLSSIIETLRDEFTDIDRTLTLDGLRIIGEATGF